MKLYEFIIAQTVVMTVMFFLIRFAVRHDRSSTRQITRSGDNAELQAMKKLRAKSLSVPLAEITRPKSLRDIVGQEDAIAALRAALCGKNPQHIIIYGPPGVGKTCAARLLLEEAKKNPQSPFDKNSRFIEIDATCVRFDERAIADPLLGCVHDPIYQGAGQLGTQGIPQPKVGAVTKAHCGVLFLDEIGELHPLQMNKLLKVLEDRRVYLDSSYYSRTNPGIPDYIHDIFQNGLPADFRLIGATTRSPEEIPPALRSRCVEIFFSPLTDDSLIEIGARAAKTAGRKAQRSTLALCASYSMSGRDCVNIMQLAGALRESGEITCRDIEWVASTCHYTQKYSFTFPRDQKTGRAYGLGVGQGMGIVLEIECVAKRSQAGGSLCINGIMEEEEIEYSNRKLRRKSLVYSSVENALSAVLNVFGIDSRNYDIVFNIIGGLPVDGPSAGAAFCAAYMSALMKKPLLPAVAVTGEITASGDIRPVGGIREKITSAFASGADMCIVPVQNLDEARAVAGSVTGAGDIRELVRGLMIRRTVQTDILEA